MKILIEAFDYPLPIIQTLLPPNLWQHSPNQMNYARTMFIGFYNNAKGNSILILPKIFLHTTTQSIVQQIPIIEAATHNLSFFLRKGVLQFSFYNYLLHISIKLYQSFQLYQIETKRKEDLATIPLAHAFIKAGELHHIELLQIVLTLIDFYHKHKATLFKEKKIINANANNINWHKTLQKEKAYIQENRPIYIASIRQKKKRDYTDNLYKLFYQVLAQIKEEYSIDIQHLPTIIAHIPFQKAYKLLLLWQSTYTKAIDKELLNLLRLYFEKASKEKARQKPYFLLCQHYEYVFEAMLDKLLSTPESQYLKEQKDGGIIDHLFEYKALLGEGKSFYIADAKYYKESTQYSTYTQYKQYVYARNLAQSLLYKKALCPITEAYLPIGNIFIQAHLDNWQNAQANLKTNTLLPFSKQQHFENRFFDRDTLFIGNTQLNYNFILDFYIQPNTIQSIAIKEDIRHILLHIYASLYNIYILSPSINITTFIHLHYKTLTGKIAYLNKENNTCIYIIEKQYTIPPFILPFIEQISFHTAI